MAATWPWVGLTDVATADGQSLSDHWSFQPVARPPIPVVRNGSWPLNPIDNFVLARLDQAGIVPAPEADRATLLRRVTLDLIGVPPTPDEVDDFLADTAPDAYERVVNRLLGSRHYGERWARHWLDIARYADSAGHEFDTKRPLWRFRDWVIQALNEDKPYDQFLLEQLAGDLISPPSSEQLIATGFSCNALKQYGDIEETTIDRVNAFGTAYLGLTIACAQCHDHPFDPISQTEYYQLYAFFNQAEDTEYELESSERIGERNAVRQQVAQLKLELATYQSGPDSDPLVWAARLSADEVRSLHSVVREAVLKISVDRTAKELETVRAAHALALAQFERDVISRFDAWEAKLTDEQRKSLSPEAQAYLALPSEQRPATRPPAVIAEFWKRDPGYIKRSESIKQLEESIPEALTTLVLRQRIGEPKSHVFVGGDPHHLGDEVNPDTPKVLPALRINGPAPSRMDLARWAVSRDNPLTARVAMNRSWQVFFGAGIVETSENLGLRGSEPSHAELLDWLAAELMDQHWSLKHVHRLIVTSATYRESSRARVDLEEIDPQNRLLARQNRLRLEAEIIRDAALACSGLLDPTIGGPSVFPYQPEGIMDGRADGTKWAVSEGPNRFRRGLYTHYWRLTPHPYLRLFDVPDASEACTRRPRTNTPLQALTLLNDPWFTEAAVALASRACEESPANTEAEQLDSMYRASLARRVTADEQRVLFELLREQRESLKQDPQRAVAIVGEALTDDEAIRRAAWTAVARVLLNLDEFITRE
ncbi:MAG: DUF1549 and DUF1553 domain-containing protein [Pirellulales bacterium]